MFGKPRSSIPVAGRTSIPVKRTAQGTTNGRSTPASANSSIPGASKVSGKLFEAPGFDLWKRFSSVLFEILYCRSSIVTRNEAKEHLTTDER